MSWVKVRLDEVCNINIGKTPARANNKYWGIGNPWLSIADMSQGRDISITKEEITDICYVEVVRRNDMILMILISYYASRDTTDTY